MRGPVSIGSDKLPIIDVLEAQEKGPAVRRLSLAKNRNEIFKQQQLTIGVDVEIQSATTCILDETGNVILERGRRPRRRESSKSLARSALSNRTGKRDAFALAKPAVDAVWP